VGSHDAGQTTSEEGHAADQQHQLTELTLQQTARQQQQEEAAAAQQQLYIHT
jgi:hypothetical protein